MTLRRKTLLIVGLSLGALFFVVYLVVSFISLSGFNTIERQDVNQNVSRALQALADEISKLDTSAGDYAPWDDAYEFVTNHNQDFIDSNLGSESMGNLKLNALIYLDNDHQIVYGRSLNLETDEAAPVPD